MASSPNINLIVRWLEAAKPGARLVYWRGNLSRDRVERSFRVREPGMLVEVLEPCDPADTVARMMLAAEKEGTVRLFQKRIEEEDYQYIAVRR
jgi:hypothetical protein